MLLNIFVILATLRSTTGSSVAPQALLFSSRACAGEYVKFSGESVSSLRPYFFDDLAYSVYVTGPWIFYELENFNRGIAPMEYIFEPSPRCVNLRIVAGHVSSLRNVGSPQDFRVNSFNLYATRDFQGDSELISASTPNLYSYGNQRSLIITGQTPWTIYDRPYYSGRALCLVPARSAAFAPALIPNFVEFKPEIRIGSIASVKPGCAKNVEEVTIPKRYLPDVDI